MKRIVRIVPGMGEGLRVPVPDGTLGTCEGPVEREWAGWYWVWFDHPRCTEAQTVRADEFEWADDVLPCLRARLLARYD